MHSTMKIACYSTHTVDLKNKDNTTRKLKNIKSKPKEPAGKKKILQKRQLFCLPRRMLSNGKGTDRSQSYRWFLLHTAGRSRWLDLPRNNCMSRTLSVKTRSKILFFSFFFFYQNTFYRIPNQNVLYLRHLFITFFSSLKDDSHAAV